MTEQELRQKLEATLNLASLAENVTTFNLKQRLQDICKAYAAAHVAAKDAENERLKAELEGVKCNLQGQVDARKRDLTSKRELNGINRSLRDENKRLREGYASISTTIMLTSIDANPSVLIDWIASVVNALLCPKEDGKPIDPPAPVVDENGLLPCPNCNLDLQMADIALGYCFDCKTLIGTLKPMEGGVE